MSLTQARITEAEAREIIRLAGEEDGAEAAFSPHRWIADQPWNATGLGWSVAGVYGGWVRFHIDRVPHDPTAVFIVAAKWCSRETPWPRQTHILGTDKMGWFVSRL